MCIPFHMLMLWIALCCCFAFFDLLLTSPIISLLFWGGCLPQIEVPHYYIHTYIATPNLKYMWTPSKFEYVLCVFTFGFYNSCTPSDISQRIGPSTCLRNKQRKLIIMHTHISHIRNNAFSFSNELRALNLVVLLFF